MNISPENIKRFAENQNVDLNEAVSRMRENFRDEFKGKEYVSKSDSLRRGQELREQIPLETHGQWKVEKDRVKAAALLQEQEASRVQELIPLRHKRMSASPFAFYRGSAIIMADDLATTPSTGINVQAVGDAHISNFGMFSSAERRLVFDINDFDETLPGPWEWDVKRLMASIEICGRDLSLSGKARRKAVYHAAKSYREAMLNFSDMGSLDVWYAHLDIADQLAFHGTDMSTEDRKAIRKATEKALSRTSASAVGKLTEVADGKLRIKSDPPVLVPMRDLYKGEGGEEVMLDFISKMLTVYRHSLPRERRDLISQYKVVDAARKVVGVGSVGTKAWMVVLEGYPGGDPLVLQIKEANASVLERYLEKSHFAEHGRRVVEGQRAIQTAGDILLGYIRIPTEKGYEDYYVRQLWDGKGSVDLSKLSADSLMGVANLCAWTLAHAHAKTGNRHAIAGYLGQGKDFENAMTAFADAYADQNEADYEVFLRDACADA